jgi:hypothetical protein
MAYINGKKLDFVLLQGRSAYEIAVDNGFEGTEQEWLDSLHGSGEGGGGSTIVIDSVLSSTSTNPVQNKAITGYIHSVGAQAAAAGSLASEVDKKANDALAQIGDIDAALDGIIAIQEALLGGGSV